MFNYYEDRFYFGLHMNPDLSTSNGYIDLSDCRTHLTGDRYLVEDDDQYRLFPASSGILGTLNAKKPVEAGLTGLDMFTAISMLILLFEGRIILDQAQVNWFGKIL